LAGQLPELPIPLAGQFLKEMPYSRFDCFTDNLLKFGDCCLLTAAFFSAGCFLFDSKQRSWMHVCVVLAGLLDY
jgi:hypothetical protein